MRMWMVDPKDMCRQHLLGEHNELHMIVGCINKGKSLEGYYEKKLIDTNLIKERHEELQWEMIKRGYRHNSPLPKFDNPKKGELVLLENIKELLLRCKKCKELYYINRRKEY